MRALLKGLEVLKDAGIVLSKLPKLLKKDVLSENPNTNKSKVRVGLLLIDSKAYKDIESDKCAFPMTPSAASLGFICGVRHRNKQDKLALYLTLCAIGIQDHTTATVSTITGNADKAHRDNAFEEYESDLALVFFFEEHKALKAHVLAIYDHIQDVLFAVDSARLRKAS